MAILSAAGRQKHCVSRVTPSRSRGHFRFDETNEQQFDVHLCMYHIYYKTLEAESRTRRHILYTAAAP